MGSRERVSYIDNLRALAIIFVVICHVTEKIFIFNIENLTSYPFIKQITALTLFTIGRLGVPIFFFITGFLLLGREYDEERTRRFYQNNLLGLLITTEIWIFLYNIFNSVFYQSPFHFDEYLRNALFVRNTAISHMWYMPVILGIYMMIPFVANMLRRANKLIMLPLGVAFIVLFLIPEVNVILNAKGIAPMYALLDLNFAGGVYGVYVLLGYFLKKYDSALKQIPRSVLLSVVVIMLGMTILFQWYSYRCGIAFNVWYNNATLIVAAYAFTILVSTLSLDCKVLKIVSKYSFAIYLLHNPVLKILDKLFAIPSSAQRFCFLFPATILISLFASMILCREKHLAKYGFFVK